MGQNPVVPRYTRRTERPGRHPSTRGTWPCRARPADNGKTTNKHDETTTYAPSRGRAAGRRRARRRRQGRLRGQARRTRRPYRRRSRRPCRRSHRPPARGTRTRTPLLRARSWTRIGRAGPADCRRFDRHANRRGIAGSRTAARVTVSTTGIGARKLRADACTERKKARTAGSGLIHLRRRVEETCGGCRSATTNEAHYTNAPPTSQENLHYEISHHDAKYGEFHGTADFPL